MVALIMMIIEKLKIKNCIDALIKQRGALTYNMMFFIILTWQVSLKNSEVLFPFIE